MSNSFTLDVDGGYSEWSTFSECSLTCGEGVQGRERTCNNPAPKGKGKSCDHLGPTTETKKCKLAECAGVVWFLKLILHIPNTPLCEISRKFCNFPTFFSTPRQPSAKSKLKRALL